MVPREVSHVLSPLGRHFCEGHALRLREVDPDAQIRVRFAAGGPADWEGDGGLGAAWEADDFSFDADAQAEDAG